MDVTDIPMTKETKTKINKTAVVATAAGVAAAAIGAYWLYGSKNAAKHRKTAASWALKARAEVMDAVGKLKEIDKAAYLKIVDEIIQKYAKIHDNAPTVAQISKEMKAAWTQINAATKPVKKLAKKAVKKS